MPDFSHHLNHGFSSDRPRRSLVESRDYRERIQLVDGPPVAILGDDQVRKAKRIDRTLLALRMDNGRRRDPGRQKLVQTSSGLLGLTAQRRVELDLTPALGFDVEDGTTGNRDAEHLFQTQSLSTELGLVVIPP